MPEQTLTCPPGVDQEHHNYLVELRDSTVVNMWGAAPYLARRFHLHQKDAEQVLVKWIEGLS